MDRVAAGRSGTRRLLHFEARAVPGQLADTSSGRGEQAHLNLGHNGPVVHVQDDDGSAGRAQVDLLVIRSPSARRDGHLLAQNGGPVPLAGH